MTEVFYFSGSGHSFAVAKAVSERLGCGLAEISKNIPAAETAVVVFPVYCQNIPGPVKAFLQSQPSKYIALIATYGKISYGNVLFEAQRLVRGEVIAGAYIPTGHTFLDEEASFDVSVLLPLLARINAPQRAHIQKTRKNPLSDLSPALRSRLGVKIIKNQHCNHCGLCEKHCPTGAIRNGRISANCIRCLRCVASCPQKALWHQNRWILKKYLERRRKEEAVLYL